MSKFQWEDTFENILDVQNKVLKRQTGQHEQDLGISKPGKLVLSNQLKDLMGKEEKIKEQMTHRRTEMRSLQKNKEVLEIKIGVIKIENDFDVLIYRRETQAEKNQWFERQVNRIREIPEWNM